MAGRGGSGKATQGAGSTTTSGGSSTDRTKGELIEKLAPLGLVLAVLFVGLLTLFPFLAAILWGVVLAIAVAPIHQKLLRSLGNRRGLAATITGFGLALCFVLPAIGIARALAAFLPSALNWVERVALAGLGTAPEPVLNLPLIGKSLAEFWRTLGTDLSSVATHFGDELKALLVWAAYEAEVLGIFFFYFAIGVIIAAALLYNFDRLSVLSQKFL